MEVITLDTSVLISYYRSNDKKTSFLFDLAGKYSFTIPAIVKYEVFKGDKNQDPFWRELLSDIPVLPFDDACSKTAAKIYLDLKKRSQLIPTDDILIAATDISNNLPLATINVKDFSRIENLSLLTPP